MVLLGSVVKRMRGIGGGLRSERDALQVSTKGVFFSTADRLEVQRESQCLRQQAARRARARRAFRHRRLTREERSRQQTADSRQQTETRQQPLHATTARCMLLPPHGDWPRCRCQRPSSTVPWMMCGSSGSQRPLTPGRGGQARRGEAGRQEGKARRRREDVET